MLISEKLSKLRAKHKVTNQQIADLSGIPIGTISGIMSGQTANPSFAYVCAILEALEEDIAAFYRGEDSPTQTKPAQPDTIETLDRIQRKAVEITTAAITKAYADDMVVRSERRERRSMMLNFAFIVLIVFVLVWDITHPDMGYVRY